METLRASRHGRAGAGRALRPVPPPTGLLLAGQFGKGLEGAQVIFGTDAHIARSPDFGSQLAGWAGAARVLTLVDEINFLATGFRRRVARADLVRFARVLGEVDSGRWVRSTATGAGARSSSCGPRAGPASPRLEDADVPDRLGGRGPGPWLGSPRHAVPFPRARPAAVRPVAPGITRAARQRRLELHQPPAVRGDVAIFSGTALPEFLRFRLGRDLACPFAGYQFGHPGTRWYNIASRLGMRAHFPGNADQILDFFASLVSRRLSEGRRPLLIAKKWFAEFCSRR